MTQTLPLTVGAALPVHRLADFRDWLFQKDRDLELQTFAMPDVLDSDWRGLADQVNSVMAGFQERIGIHGPFLGFDISSKDPLIREVVTKRMMQGLDVCEAVGASQMMVHSPYNMWMSNSALNFDDNLAWVTEMAHLTLDPVVRRAEAQGVMLVIENIGDIDMGARVRMAESFDSPSVQVSVDTGHAHLCHGSIGAHPAEYYIKAAGASLQHVHLQDADGHADRHWAIGEGNILWHSVFRAIAALETDPRLILELRDHNGIPASMAHLEAAGLAQ